MTKPRKLHQLTGQIKGCWRGQVTSKKSQYQGQNFYYLEITTQNLFTKNQKEVLYAFPNLVSKDIWTTLEQQTFKNQKYLFYYEKRVRGWRLKEMEEIEKGGRNRKLKSKLKNLDEEREVFYKLTKK